MLCSKFKSCFPAAATPFNSIPKDLALATADAIASTLPPNWALICPVIVPVSLSIPLMSNLVPLSFSTANAEPTASTVNSFTLLPDNIAD